MSVGEDVYGFDRAFCEHCAVKGCWTYSLSYDENGQEAIDAIERCVHFKNAVEVLSRADHYRVE